MFSPAGERQIFPKQTKRTLNDVLGIMPRWCRFGLMLARMILHLCLMTFVSGADSKPHVILIVNSDITEIDGRLAVDKVFSKNIDFPSGVAWRKSRCDVRLSPGGNATLAALLYGKQSLVCGVVGDHDWRRKPVRSTSLADHFALAGYTTVFSGAWSMGVSPPYDCKSRGFKAEIESRDSSQSALCRHLEDDWIMGGKAMQSQVNLEKSLKKLWMLSPPVFMMAHCRGMKDSVKMSEAIKVMAENAWKMHKRETYCIIVSALVKKADESWHLPHGSYHNPSSTKLYHIGLQKNFTQYCDRFHHCATDWELNTALLGLVADVKPAKPEFRVFHAANWADDNAPDKHRYRGSLVVGKEHALVDGLELYPANNEMLPNLSKPLDITQHQKLHTEMLLAHTNWWRSTRKALYDPRSFSVGKKDKHPVRLSAMDWRPSKIMHADNKHPSSQPVIEQQKLLDLLRGLQQSDFRQQYPAHSGSWAVNILRPGRYQIKASLLPTNIDDRWKKLAALRGGRAFIRIGQNLVQLQLVKGATSVTVQADADAGITDLECWFTGQLAVERELGAFFVEIQRIGDKKFNLKAKPE